METKKESYLDKLVGVCAVQFSEVIVAALFWRIEKWNTLTNGLW